MSVVESKTTIAPQDHKNKLNASYASKKLR